MRNEFVDRVTFQQIILPLVKRSMVQDVATAVHCSVGVCRVDTYWHSGWPPAAATRSNNPSTLFEKRVALVGAGNFGGLAARVDSLEIG